MQSLVSLSIAQQENSGLWTSGIRQALEEYSITIFSVLPSATEKLHQDAHLHSQKVFFTVSHSCCMGEKLTTLLARSFSEFVLGPLTFKTRTPNIEETENSYV